MVGDDGSIVFGSPLAVGSQEIYIGQSSCSSTTSGQTVTFDQPLYRLVVVASITNSYNSDSRTLQLVKGESKEQGVTVYTDTNSKTTNYVSLSLSNDGRILTISKGSYWHASAYSINLALTGYV